MAGNLVLIGVILFMAGISLLFALLSVRAGRYPKMLLRASYSPHASELESGHRGASGIATVSGLLRAASRVSTRMLPDRITCWIARTLPLDRPPWGLSTKEAAALRVFLAIPGSAFPVTLFKLTPLGISLAIVAGGALFFSPSLVQRWESRDLMRLVERGLPQIADLMYAALLGGKSVIGALEVAASRVEGPAGDLFRQACLDINGGISKERALGEVLASCPSRDLSLFVNSLLRSERFGFSYADTLRIQADHLRYKDRAYRRTRAGRLPLKMLVPLVFLILPASILLILGPVVLSALSRLG